jgi:CHAT domain-containing protein
MALSTLSKSVDIGNLQAPAVDLAGRCGYLCGVLNALLIILSLLLPAGALSAQTGEASPVRPAEYMIYQYAGVDLVVKIDAPEVEFEARIYGPEQALLKSSGVPFRRIGPVYQFVEAVETSRQLMVKVTPGKKMDRSRITMELIQLSAHDRNSPALASAYKLLSYGTESAHSNDTTTWTTKAYSLMNAARAFAALGWEEMRLWAEYFAAHLILYQLEDRVSVIERAQEISRSAERAGFEEIEMAALLLESEAMLRGGTTVSGRRADAHFQQVHLVLIRLADRARQLGLHSEQARALFNDGLAWGQQDRLEKAIEQFRDALEVALAAGDTELADEIRGTAAMAYETLGRTSGAIGMLEDVGTDIRGESVEADNLELAENLFEKGRILNANYRFFEARADLARALALQRSGAGAGAWGPTGLALAWAHLSLGETERAAGLIIESLPRTSIGSDREQVMAAYGWLAGIYRERAEFQAMDRYRGRQESLVRSDRERADYLLEAGLDALAREGAASGQAGQYFSRSRDLAATNGDSAVGHRAQLYRCLNRIERSRGQACDAATVRQGYERLSRSGIPRLAVESEFIRSQILRREGRPAEALAGMESLMREILFLRQSLRGVLGAWYWQNRTAIFREYMAGTVAATAAGGDGRSVLLALDHIRLLKRLERAERSARRPDDREEALRVRLGRREAAGALPADDDLSRRLRDIRDRFEPTLDPVELNTLDGLLKELGKNESLLTYYLDGRDAHAIVGGRDGVRIVQLTGAEMIPALIRQIRQAAGRSDPSALPLLDQLGSLMIEPVADALTARVYLQPLGFLNGFPFDLIRLRGQFLAQRLQLVNLLSLTGLEHRNRDLPNDFAETVFLAGNPQAEQKLFSYEVAVSSEINTVTDRFVGPGLHIVQGVALTREEFSDERFGNAGLIHLAMPGTLDPAFPDRSRLRLSGTAGSGQGRDLEPSDIRALDVRASLVFLSGTQVADPGDSPFDSELGFVSDFLESGADHAIVTAWRAGDEHTTSFVGAFYERLTQTANVAEALSETRISRIDPKNLANFGAWAGFQLYIR